MGRIQMLEIMPRMTEAGPNLEHHHRRLGTWDPPVLQSGLEVGVAASIVDDVVRNVSTLLPARVAPR